MKTLRRVLPPLIPALLISVLFEVLVRGGWVASYILPAPTDVFRSLIEDRDELLLGFRSTLTAASIGLMLSAVVGITVAMALSLSALLRRAFLPYAVFFQTVPVIALAPVLVIWFGFGLPTVVASAFIVSIFPVIANTLLGLRSTDPALVDLFRLHRASTLTTLMRLRFPAALPSLFAGLRIAAGLAVIGAVVGEFIAGGGLGEVVDAARTQQRLDKVFAAVILSSLLGLLAVVAIDAFSRWSLGSWHVSENDREQAQPAPRER